MKIYRHLIKWMILICKDSCVSLNYVPLTWRHATVNTYIWLLHFGYILYKDETKEQ